MKRVFLIVLDSLGIGEAPDAHLFGDAGANTLLSAYKSGELEIPNLISLGLGNIDGVDFLGKAEKPLASYGRLREISAGKDTTIGHFEIAGLHSKAPLPTYPCGFPEEIIGEFEKRTGRKTLCNKPYSGTEVILKFGEEHRTSGALIVYTSADSVFQIAAHEDTVALDTLYEYCKIARELLTGEHAVGRVIARPFTTEDGKFVRTANRRDFSLTPPKPTMLDAIKDSGLSVIAVGKISDIFAGQGITEELHTSSNTDGLATALKLADRDFSGLAFINLVDFDSKYGHRQDAVGYARAICEFDRWLPSFLKKMGEEDALIITADHGCDPSDNSTDHTREYTPLLVYGKTVSAENLGTKSSFTNVSRIVCDMLEVDFTPDA